MGERELGGHRHICGPCWNPTHSHAPGVEHCGPEGSTLAKPATTPPATSTHINTVMVAAHGKGSISFELPAGRQVGVNLPAYGQRLDVPGPMMRSLRDPSLSLSALSGLDDASPPIMVEPPDREFTALPKTQILSGRRIGFAKACRAASVVTRLEHCVSFLRVLDQLSAAGMHLIALEVSWSPGVLPDGTDAQSIDTLPPGFCTSSLNELLLEHRLDAWVCDARLDIFPGAIRDGYSHVSVPTGSDIQGLSFGVLFYGARWGEGPLKALVRDFQQTPRARSPVDG